MFREIKSTSSYGRTMTFLSVLTLIFGVTAVFTGELIVPIATGFFAALLVFEKPKTRVISFILPIALIAFDFVINGFYSLIGVEITALSIIIAIFYVRKASKAETASYLVFAMSLLILATVYLLGAKSAASFAPSAIAEYYEVTVTNLKEYFIDNVLTLEVTAADGSVTQLMTDEEALYYVNEIANALPSLIATFSFAVAGISLKIFCAIMRRSCKYGLLKTYSHFFTSNFIAYAYIIFAIISAFSSSNGVFDIAIVNITNILMFVFAYIGLRLALTTFSQRRGMIYIIIFVAIIFMSGLAVQLLSFFGVFINISFNRQLSEKNGGGTTA